MCSIHLFAFGMASIGFDSNLKLLVFSGVNGNNIIKILFWDFEGKSIFLPKQEIDYFQDKFIKWTLEKFLRLEFK